MELISYLSRGKCGTCPSIAREFPANLHLKKHLGLFQTKIGGPGKE
jgi:hypothetical protein